MAAPLTKKFKSKPNLKTQSANTNQCLLHDEDEDEDFPRGGGSLLNREEIGKVNGAADEEFEREQRTVKRRMKENENSGKLQSFANKITLNVDKGRNRVSLRAEPTKTTDYSSACIRSINGESGNIHHPILADSETRNFVRPLEVTLDDIESLDTGGATGESVLNVSSTQENNIRRDNKRAREARELEIRAAEDRLLEKGIPRNADEFEKIIRSSPNNSFFWIKYMAYMLSLADIEKARSIAERALETINIREESEKLNIWVAHFNLENEYGNPPEEAVKKVFERALQYNDPKKVHLALLGMYERTNQHKLVDGLLEKMTRKFKHSCKVWLRKVQSLLRQNSDGIQCVVNRALLCLPRHKHIKFTSQTGILEFKCGVPNRGRSIFEGILRDYPKRTDLWSIYLDQEMRLGDADIIRALFERAICLSLPPKRMEVLIQEGSRA